MLKQISNLPDNVLGISAEGEITGMDYETMLIPLLEEKLKSNKKLHLLYYLGSSFTGFDINAMLEDAKIGVKHLSEFEKIAIVSDHPMINTFAKFFGYMIPCEVRIFKNGELEEAKIWIANISK